MALPILTPSSQISKVILPVTGNAANVTTATLPYGIYLNNTDFVSGAVDQVAFTYKMLGGDVLDIELVEGNVYSSYETAVLEYSTILNSHQAENVLSDFLGATTGTFNSDGQMRPGETLSGSNVNLKFPAFTFEYARHIADGLAAEAGFGDNVQMYSASFALTGGVQTYDLQNIVAVHQSGSDWSGSIDNKRITIHRVYYKSPSTMWRFYGYGGGINAYGNLNTYGMYADDSQFEVVPAWQNKLQAMAFETDIYTRLSHYAYEIRNTKITIYPPPTITGGLGCTSWSQPSPMWFLFSVPGNAWEQQADRTDGVDGVNNMNTLPFENIPFENINSMGKQWIRKYALAISKEMLGQIRGKFATIPIPGNDITLNASELLGQAKEEQTALKEELKALLDKLTYGALVKGDAEIADAANSIMTHVPMGIYIG
jgi:hypothetical protein